MNKAFMLNISFCLLTSLVFLPLYASEGLAEPSASAALLVESSPKEDALSIQEERQEEEESSDWEMEESFLELQSEDPESQLAEADISFDTHASEEHPFIYCSYFLAPPSVYSSLPQRRKNAPKQDLPKPKPLPTASQSAAKSVKQTTSPKTTFTNSATTSSNLASSKKDSHKTYKRGSNQELIEVKDNKFLLITGCARSGTTYITQVLKQAGLQVEHEFLAKDGCVSWLMAVDADYAPWGPPDNGIYFEHIFHQVRHPLLVISSVYTTEPKQSWDFICKHIPEIRAKDDHVVKCAKYWYYWNLKAEEKAEWTYQVEEIETILSHMSKRLKFPLSREILKCIPKTANHRGAYVHKFTWADLEAMLPPDLLSKVQTLALKYGYSIED
jgi:hypothetical protein